MRRLFVLAIPVSPALAGCGDEPGPGVDWSECEKSRQMFGSADLSNGEFVQTFFTATDLRRRESLGRGPEPRRAFQCPPRRTPTWPARFSRRRSERAPISPAPIWPAPISRAAEFSRSNFQRANLVGADLTNSEMSRSDFTEADLTGAIMAKAELAAHRSERAQSSPA